MSILSSLPAISRPLPVGLAILPHPTWHTPPRFTPYGFSPPRKGDGAGMGWDLSLAPQGGVRIGLDFLDPPHHTPPVVDKG